MGVAKPIRKICLIQPEQPFPNMLPKTFVVMPRYGIPLIATILKKAGYEVTLFVEEIRPINWDILMGADVIAFHALTCAMGRMKRIIEQIRMKSSAPIIVGGEHATYFPESVLRVADYVVRQEGDETILDLLDALATGRDVETVAGVTFKRDGKTVTTPDRPAVKEIETVVDLSTIHGWKEAYTHKGVPWPLMTVQTTRGCLFGCKFCPVQAMFGKGYRKRSIDSVIADLKDKLQYTRDVMIVDNLFEGDAKRTEELLKRIIAEGMKPSLTVFCRNTVSKNSALLRLMKEAGVSTIFVGVESLNQKSLDHADKRQSVEQVHQAIRTIQKHGIRVLASMIMGFDTDTVESLTATREMLQEWGIAQMCIFALWGAYPHNGELLIPPDRWIFRDWGYANGNFVNHFPLNMKPSTLQRQIIQTYDEVLNPKHSVKDFLRGKIDNAKWRLFFHKSWQGTRPDMLEYITWLEEMEGPYYDEKEKLRLEKLAGRPDLEWVHYHLQ